MEEKIYDVEFEENDNKYMVFKIEKKELKINLSSDDQTNLRNLFYEILQLTKTCKPVFKLTDEAKKSSDVLIEEMAEAYLIDLNKEIVSIINEMPKL